MTPDKATALREAAERATPGPWECHLKTLVKTPNPWNRHVATVREECDADYIALADPPTMKDLLAERERLRGALEAAAKRMDHCRRHIESGQVVDKDVHGALCRGRDAARQALEATDDQT